MNLDREIAADERHERTAKGGQCPRCGVPTDVCWNCGAAMQERERIVEIHIRSGVPEVERCPDDVEVKIVDWDLAEWGECPHCGAELSQDDVDVCPDCGGELWQ